MLQNRSVRPKPMFIVSILCTFPFYYGCHFLFDSNKTNGAAVGVMCGGGIKNRQIAVRFLVQRPLKLCFRFVFAVKRTLCAFIRAATAGSPITCIKVDCCEIYCMLFGLHGGTFITLVALPLQPAFPQQAGLLFRAR